MALPPPWQARGSAARLWPPIARFTAAERRLGDAAAARGPLAAGLYEFLRFGIKQGWACLFGALMLLLMLGTHLWYPADAPVARYDALVLASLAIQAALLLLRMETVEEAKVILLFHLVGTAMEVFKTAMGSWIYPEPSLLRIGGVPLFTGFMYAAVGSYLARIWRLLDFRFTRHPPFRATLVLAVLIYLNFFTHHAVADMRWALFLGAAVLFGRTTVHFRMWRAYRRMPLLLGFLLVTLFIWFAENLGTFTRAWIYPSQAAGWSPVSLAKFGSWFLLMLISYVMVSAVHGPRPMPREARAEPA
ncbi:DUF817 domain-containing protein [Roseomonas elaeocarpi]|uniref:DUF817 domain-containing protein n=1 Tax=Roseomonas elaeocarpi TaxID=907779 RepID=A0ABV6JTJ6_9PROT